MKKEPTQEELGKFVDNNIYYNQSMLVIILLQNEQVGWCDYEEIVNLYETEEEAKDNGHEEPEPQEIFEWWLCSDWLLKKLEEQGEPILKTDFGSWWGRTCTGQAILLDGVIRTIYKSI